MGVSVKRRTELLVEKRDGRREWLRLTKTTRSIERALSAAHATHPDAPISAVQTGRIPVSQLLVQRGGPLLAAELAAQAVRLARAADVSGAPLATARIAEAVQSVLIADGRPVAATCFVEVASSRMAREQEGLDQLGQREALDGGPRLGWGSRLGGDN